jgi:hypothetical protein
MRPIIRDRYGHELNEGDLVIFDAPELAGHGTLGTITKISRTTVYNPETEQYDQTYGDEYQYTVMVKSPDCEIQTGECIDARKSTIKWVFYQKQAKLTSFFKSYPK